MQYCLDINKNYNYKDMRSGLLSSLFRDNSASNRSSSLFQKHQPSITSESARTRSQSNNKNKLSDYSGPNKYIPLIRMNLLLTAKIRILKQVAFCKIENCKKNLVAERTASALKNRTQEKPALLSQLSNSLGYLCQEFTTEDSQQRSEVPEQGISKEITTNNNNRVTKDSLQNFIDVCSMLQAKYFRNHHLQSSFNSIKIHIEKKQGCQKLMKPLKKFENTQMQYQAFNNLKSREKAILKYDILIDSLQPIVKSYISGYFQQIKQISNQINVKESREYVEEPRTTEKIQEQVNIEKMKTSTKQRHNQRLHPISQEEFSFSEEEVARLAKFQTPQKPIITVQPNKNHYKSKRREQLRQSDNSEGRSHIFMKQFSSDEFDHEQIYPTSLKKQHSNNMNSAKKIAFKTSTKIHCNRVKIQTSKAPKIITSLEIPEIIQLSLPNSYDQEKNKCSELRNQFNAPEVPDQYDHFGVFQCNQMFNRREDSFPNSFRSSYKEEISCHKTLEPVKITEEEEEEIFTEITSLRKREKNGFDFETSPEFQSNRNQSFKSNPLHNIEEMMLELQSIRQKQKYLKYASNSRIGYPQCKISVNLPNRRTTFSGNSCNNSASKKSVLPNESYSQKKNKRRDILARYQNKPSQQKQNFQVKLWDQKKNTFFCPNDQKIQSKIMKKKHSSGCMSTAEASTMTTARKMKKQIQGIIRNRKNRGSIGNIKTSGVKF